MSPDVDPTTKIALDAPIIQLAGVGPQIGARFAYLGLRTVGDLLNHLPIRYEIEVAEAAVTEAKEATELAEASVTRTVRG